MYNFLEKGISQLEEIILFHIHNQVIDSPFFSPKVLGVGNISSFAGYPPVSNITKLPKQTQLGQIENVFVSTRAPGQFLVIIHWELSEQVLCICHQCTDKKIQQFNEYFHYVHKQDKWFTIIVKIFMTLASKGFYQLLVFVLVCDNPINILDPERQIQASFRYSWNHLYSPANVLTDNMTWVTPVR